MTQMLTLSGWEFKTTMIHMLRDLMEKVGKVQEQMGKHRDGNANRESEGNAKNQKLCDGNEQCF